jgi:hypothetical protein
MLTFHLFWISVLSGSDTQCDWISPELVTKRGMKTWLYCLQPVLLSYFCSFLIVHNIIYNPTTNTVGVAETSVDLRKRVPYF